MTNLNLNVGTMIAVTDSQNNTIALRTIRRVMKAFVEDTKFVKWRHDGRPYPLDQCGYQRGGIERATAQHLISYERRYLVRKLSSVNWSELDLETLRAVAGLLPRNPQ